MQPFLLRLPYRTEVKFHCAKDALLLSRFLPRATWDCVEDRRSAKARKLAKGLAGDLTVTFLRCGFYPTDHNGG